MAVVELNHPLIQHKLTHLRNKYTDTKLFREALNEISGLMIYEATKNLKLEKITIETPIMKTKSYKLSDESVSIVPILRAGLGMIDGVIKFLPSAKIGHLGVYRNEETLQPVYYYCKLPINIANSKVILLDPMLATGGSAIYAVDKLKKEGVKDIVFLSIISAPEGVKRLQEAHQDVDIYTAKIDQGLNEKSYIYPGLGDAGDRIFGTK